MKLQFLHPTGNEWFNADVEDSITGNVAISELQNAGFLPEPKEGDYNLVLDRTGKEISRKASFASAGIQPEDRLHVVYRSRGARRHFVPLMIMGFPRWLHTSD